MDFNDVCAMEPAVIAIWDFPAGTELELVRDYDGMFFGDMKSGDIVDPDSYFDPTAPPRRRRWWSRRR